jgi:Tfp pilus assembly protein PilO
MYNKFSRKIKSDLNFIRANKLKVIFLLVSFLIFIFFYKFLYYPKIEEISKDKETLKTLYKQIEKAKQIVTLYPNPDNELKKIQIQYEKYNSMLPETNSFLAITQKIVNALGDQDLEVLNFKHLYELKNSKKIKGIKKYGVEVELKANFIKIGRFLESLEKIGILYTVDEFSFGKNEEGSPIVYLKLGIYLKEK